MSEKEATVPKQSTSKSKINRGNKPSDYICTHSSTASGLYALELLDRLHASGLLSMDEVKAFVVAYDAEN